MKQRAAVGGTEAHRLASRDASARPPCYDGRVNDPYQVLGVSRDASPEEIKSAFRKLASRHHPDHNPDDKQAGERFKQINAAYQILNDPKRRIIYDRFGETGAGVGGGGVPFDFSHFAEINLDGMVGDLLGAFGIGSKSDRGNVKQEISIRFEEAVFGCEKEVSYERVELCSECRGSGAAPGAATSACPACHGRGRIRIQQGFLPLAMERSCSTCRATGRIAQTPCTSCKGEGLVRKSRPVLVQIPPGIEHNATQLVSRAGSVVRPNRAPGDLELTVKVQPHQFFRREGDHIVCSVPITFPQAALGAEVDVPMLEGRGKLRVPAGTQSGAVLRMKGKGVPRRVMGGRGDQLVEITVEVPGQLGERARQLVEELGREMGTEHQPQHRSFLEKLRDLFG